MLHLVIYLTNDHTDRNIPLVAGLSLICRPSFPTIVKFGSNSLCTSACDVGEDRTAIPQISYIRANKFHLHPVLSVGDRMEKGWP